jgi:hypothetical protein
MLQREMRETTGDVRDRRAAAVHASPTAGLIAWLWTRPLARGVAFAVAIGLFLCAVGAFGSADVPLPTRVAWFLGFSLLAGFAGPGLARWTYRLRWTRDHLWRRYLIVASLMTLIMALAVWVGLGGAFPRLRFEALPAPLFFSLVTSFVVTAVAFAVFRSPPVTHAGTADAPPPRFLDRLPPALKGGEVWAVQAEDHYLRIHTSRGDDLILMRLADAISELEGVEGAQTHRSWWVARDAVRDVARADGRAILTLPSGVEAPVSRTYARTLRAAGWF